MGIVARPGRFVKTGARPPSLLATLCRNLRHDVAQDIGGLGAGDEIAVVEDQRRYAVEPVGVRHVNIRLHMGVKALVVQRGQELCLLYTSRCV